MILRYTHTHTQTRARTHARTHTRTHTHARTHTLTPHHTSPFPLPPLLLQAEGHFDYRGDLHSVHRLDNPTSGLLIFAKSASSQTALSRAFEERAVLKYYVGISGRPPSRKMGKVVGDMEPSRRGCYKILRSTANPAVTHFTTRGIPFSEKKGLRFILMKPETGKTHQVIK
ncbi:pseudouridine synthase [Pavlovales sp. CCMP2436]|nr:pseudouridine synthase [Pavlovales sp. CCMP2436]